MELPIEIVMSDSIIKDCLNSNSNLIPFKKIHSTMLFVGGKDTNDEEYYFSNQNRKCIIEIDGHGYSNNALALRVKSVKFSDDNTDVKTFAIKQHVTVALAKNIKAVDSVKTLLGEGTIIDYEKPLIVEGILLRNLMYVKILYSIKLKIIFDAFIFKY